MNNSTITTTATVDQTAKDSNNGGAVVASDLDFDVHQISTLNPEAPFVISTVDGKLLLRQVDKKVLSVIFISNEIEYLKRLVSLIKAVLKGRPVILSFFLSLSLFFEGSRNSIIKSYNS